MRYSWLYLIFNNRKDSEYIEGMLGAFDLYLSLKQLQLTILIYTREKHESVTLFAVLNDLEFVLINNKRITHLAVTYSDNIPVDDNHIYAVVPKYPED